MDSVSGLDNVSRCGCVTGYQVVQSIHHLVGGKVRTEHERILPTQEEEMRTVVSLKRLKDEDYSDELRKRIIDQWLMRKHIQWGTLKENGRTSRWPF